MEKKNNLDPQYNKLLEDILTNGVKKQTRNGEVLSVFGRQIRHKMQDGFPLLTTKKMAFKTMVKELLWFVRGIGDQLMVIFGYIKNNGMVTHQH